MASKPVKEGTLLWEPSYERIQNANITRYLKWLEERKQLRFDDYAGLWEWSVTDIEAFWTSIWEFFEIKASKPSTKAISERKMPGARWFMDAELNYAQHVFRNMSTSRPAMIFQSEFQPMREIAWDDLYRKVAAVAASLRKMGVKKGDRIAALMPNIPETIIAFLACASIGAVWSSCSPDFGTRSIIDRFRQIEPQVLFATDGYQYGGKPFDRQSVVSDLQKALTTLEPRILVPYLQKEADAINDMLAGLRDKLCALELELNQTKELWTSLRVSAADRVPDDLERKITGVGERLEECRATLKTFKTADTRKPHGRDEAKAPAEPATIEV